MAGRTTTSASPACPAPTNLPTPGSPLTNWRMTVQPGSAWPVGHPAQRRRRAAGQAGHDQVHALRESAVSRHRVDRRGQDAQSDSRRRLALPAAQHRASAIQAGPSGLDHRSGDGHHRRQARLHVHPVLHVVVVVGSAIFHRIAGFRVGFWAEASACQLVVSWGPSTSFSIGIGIIGILYRLVTQNPPKYVCQLCMYIKNEHF